MTPTPITATEARALFAPWRDAPALLLAVSGGPDSVALLWLMARWRRGLKRGPRLTVVTIDHGLRREAAAEARAVKALAASLGLDHRTRRWRGLKPTRGIQAAARAARYRLLFEAARAAGATHILTAHTLDDQAETVLMRLVRGSGIGGLAAMAVQSPRDGLVLARPLLSIPKARLIATLKGAGIPYASDPSNADPAFTRPRLRALLPALAEEGGDAATLARLAGRMARADAALEAMVDEAASVLDRSAGVLLTSPRRGEVGSAKQREAFFATIRVRGGGSIDGLQPPHPNPLPSGERERAADDARQRSELLNAIRIFDSAGFMAFPVEIRIRLLLRAIDATGHEGPAELGKVEVLAALLAQAWAAARKPGQKMLLKRTLAGAVIVLAADQLTVTAAPRRKSR